MTSQNKEDFAAAIRRKKAEFGQSAVSKVNNDSPIVGTHRQTTTETNETVHKKKMTRSFDDLEKTALSLSADITLALAMEIDELPSHKVEFKAKMQSTFMHILNTATLREEQVIFFNDAVPGFALMLFKKKPMDEVFDTPIEWDIYSDEDSPEAYAASVLAEQFFKSTKTKVVSIESEDALFVFFPVADLKKNLKEMGFYNL